jgi:hypothetical protein
MCTIPLSGYRETPGSLALASVVFKLLVIC